MRKMFSAFVLLLSPVQPSFARAAPISYESFAQKPKLVVVMVVDQFRADYLTRFSSRFLPAKAKDGKIGGYQYLTSKGAYYPFAQYDVLQCMTGPGHAMILSGAYPYQMGISLNGWYDRVADKPVYCAADEAAPVVGTDVKWGYSPKYFVGTTLGDELKNSGYPSRVVTVALKDRSAIFLGGRRADLALWFDPKPTRWVSSKYYLPKGELPPWVEKLNQRVAGHKAHEYVWKESGTQATGLTVDTKAFEYRAPYGSKQSLGYPLGLELTADAVESALEAMKLGRGKSTDILAFSFSSHDYLAHQFGPNAYEMEEMTVAEDRVISRLLNLIDQKVGLKNVTLVLTADHGGPPSAAFLKSVKIDAGQIDFAPIQERIEKYLDTKFQKSGKEKWIRYQFDLNIYLSEKAIAERGVSREAVEEEVQTFLKAEPWVAFTFSASDYKKGRLPPGMFERQIKKTFVPEKNGDVVVIPKPFYFTDNDPVGHMTSYSYDRTVPLIIAGPKIKAGVYSTPADVIDLAPTLSFLLGIAQPTGSEGRVLSEIL